MARTLAFAYKRGEIIQTSPANIDFDEEQNGRAFLYTVADFSDLLEDLRSGKGIHTPIWCRPIQKEGGQGLHLVAGQRRLLAGLEYIKENPEYLIKVLVVEPKDDMESLEMNARENAGRAELSIIDQGHVAIRLREEPTKEGGRSINQISKLLKISTTQVNQAIRLVTELPEVVQRAIHNKKVTVDDALTILKVMDPVKRAALINEFLSGKKEELVIKTMPVSLPEQPVGQIERPIPTEAVGVRSIEEDEVPKRNVREAVRDAGGKVALRMPELKKYFQEAVDEDGPGSNKGEVKLKQKLLLFVAGEISQRTMDDWFNKLCKAKGE